MNKKNTKLFVRVGRKRVHKLVAVALWLLALRQFSNITVTVQIFSRHVGLLNIPRSVFQAIDHSFIFERAPVDIDASEIGLE